MNEQFTPSIPPFCFQEGVAITQALLQADDYAKAGLRHAAVLHQEKGYDKLNRKLQPELMNEWIDPVRIMIVRVQLRPLQIRMKSGTANYMARLMRGIPQGAPSSPLLFNIYVDQLAVNAELSECALNGNGGVFIVSDDVLLQARTQENLPSLIKIVARWYVNRQANWSTRKCTYLQEERGKRDVTLWRARLKEQYSELYLCVAFRTDSLTDSNAN